MQIQARSFVLFLVDGMRPDGMMMAHTPAIDRLRADGAHTLTAQTVMPSISLPCHMSLFHGVPPTRHGITTNVYVPQVRPVPGLFDVLQQAGLITAAFYNWEELRDLGRPGALNVSFMVQTSYEDEITDTAVTGMAAGWLGENPFHFAFVYLGGTDMAGHRYGWMSPGYLKAIAHADRCIGRIVSSLPEGSTVLVTSDHGGHDQTHGTDSPEDMTTPMILWGPGIPAGSAIHKGAQITDIAPTITDYFGVAAPAEWIGAPLKFN